MTDVAPVHIPQNRDELTAPWLGEVLGTTVDSVHAEDIGYGTGFMGEILKLDLEHDSQALPRSVVAKLPNAQNQSFGEMLGLYEREILFYREFGDRLPIRAPRAWHSDFDRDSASEQQREILRALNRWPLFLSRLISWLGKHIAASKQRRYLLLLEYLESGPQPDPAAGFTESQCAIVLAEIAKLHRGFWADTTLDEPFWLLELDIDSRMRHGIYRQHVDAYAASMGEDVAPQLDWLRENAETLFRRFSADAPSTLLHCDLRTDNVLIDADRCAILDFQLVRSGPAAYDVAYFLTSALGPSEDRELRSRLLQGYHAALSAPDYEYDAFRRDVDRAVMIVLSNLASVDEVDTASERGTLTMNAWLERLRHFARDIDPATLL